MNPKYKPNLLATAVMLAFSAPTAYAQVTEISLDEAAAQDTGDSRLSAEEASQALLLGETRVLGTAEQEVKQALGASVITAEDIKKRPPVNDLSDIIRTMPGVNLTGNSATGQRGNNRQIDIRGMGPENTLILIDGKPTTSRNSVRYGWRGERDSRGDSNWVPAEQVERIEVLRGPAAARYGSGAAGGVVNIITKRPTDKVSGSLTLFTNLPEDGDEGATRRANFSLSGPLTEQLTYRVYGSANKTDSDSPGINAGHQVADPDTTLVAGREGVRNRDINTLLSWKLSDEQTLELEAGFSRQGNIYAGDSQNANSSDLTESLAGQGAETNRMYRQNYAITHHGDWEFGSSRVTLAYDSTRNNRLKEGLGGSVEGQINTSEYSSSVLDNYRLDGEINLPIDAVFQQVVTIGGEWSESKLDDPGSTQNGSNTTGQVIPGTESDPSLRDSVSKARIAALFVEDNIELRPGTILTPGLRLDEHSEFGINWSPSLNGSQVLNDQFTLKGGIARAFKAPNLYQSNSDYLLATMGNGCPIQIDTGRCFLVGNKDLDAEISVNKEIGIEFKGEQISSSLTYFRNDYKNKIVAGTEVLGNTADGSNILQWTNAKKAVVQGVEGNLLIPFSDALSWNTNFTYMIESIDKDTGNPLSLTPEYTVNSSLDWQANDKLSLQLTTVFYGEQEPPTKAVSRNQASGVSTESVDPYNIWGVSAGYAFTEQLSTRVGISNIFDKRLYREGNTSSAGAATYNEPGRALYMSLTTSF